ncbi:hypothetical protein ACNJN1_25115 [Citrobacter freundii]
MSVKRYWSYIGGDSSMQETETGNYVNYEDYASLERKNIELAVQLANAESKCGELAAENVYLLNGASRELNTSWMFHKTMLGAQAALVCLTHGYQASAREWLEGTTDEAGAEIPDDISVGELHEWFESNMVSNGGNSGFLTRKEAEVAIRKECPSTDSFLAEVRASARNDFIGRIEWIIRNECNPDKTEAIINELQNFSDELKLEAAQ